MKTFKRLLGTVVVFGGMISAFAADSVVAPKNGVDEKQPTSPSVEDKRHPKKIDFNFNNLIEEAKKAREKAYCPYSKFKVGAAVLAKSGKVYTGCNVENASYGLTNCAERTAIFKAVSEGETGNFIKAIAVVLDAPDFGAPCGTCRQVINEFADPNAIVIMATVNGRYKIECLETLLPYAFKLEDKEAQN